jgi:hypothetical protein
VTKTFTLTVLQAPSFPASVPTAASFQVGTLGNSGTIHATAGTPTATTLSVSGKLPAGVVFSPTGNGTANASAKFTGTPAAGTGGTYVVTVNAANSVGKTNTTFTLTVNQAPAFTSATAALFAVGQNVNFTVKTTGFPAATFQNVAAINAVLAGTGLTFIDNGNGTATISGIPTAATTTPITLNLSAHNGIGIDAPQSLKITIDQAPSFTGMTGGSSTFTVGKPGSFTINAQAGTPTITTFAITSGKLPAGLILGKDKNGNALISGTPLAATGGLYNFTITASNSAVSKATYSAQITVLQSPAIISANVATFVVGNGGSFTVRTTGYPISITASGLPAGLNLVDNNNGTATIFGVPSAGSAQATPYNVTITAKNLITGATAPLQTLRLTVSQAPAITSPSSASFALGTPIGPFVITTTGFPTPVLTLTGLLPPGLTMVNAGGTITITGTPKTPGTYTLLIAASAGTLTKSYQVLTFNVT